MQVIFMMKRPAIFCSIVIAAALIFTFTVAMLKRAPKTLGSKIEEGVSLEKVSENVTIVSPEGNYSLKITAVYDAPPESDDENAPPAKRVAVVVYEYTNNDIENGLVISNSHFKAFDKNGNELKQFPQKNLFEPGSIGTDGTHTASVAFALNSDENYIEVDYFNDISSKKPDSVFLKEW